MDGMDMPTGTPWMDQPVVLHDEGGRVFTCKFNDTALCNWQTSYWRFWYALTVKQRSVQYRD